MTTIHRSSAPRVRKAVWQIPTAGLVFVACANTLAMAAAQLSRSFVFRLPVQMDVEPAKSLLLTLALPVLAIALPPRIPGQRRWREPVTLAAAFLMAALMLTLDWHASAVAATTAVAVIIICFAAFGWIVDWRTPPDESGSTVLRQLLPSRIDWRQWVRRSAGLTCWFGGIDATLSSLAGSNQTWPALLADLVKDAGLGMLIAAAVGAYTRMRRVAEKERGRTVVGVLRGLPAACVLMIFASTVAKTGGDLVRCSVALVLVAAFAVPAAWLAMDLSADRRPRGYS